MRLEQMLWTLHFNLKRECFSDIHKKVKVSQPTISRWRENPPIKPSLHVFCKFANYYKLDYKFSDIKHLI